MFSFRYTFELCELIRFGLRYTSVHGASTLHLHADNCCSENINNFMMCCLAWRVVVAVQKVSMECAE